MEQYILQYYKIEYYVLFKIDNEFKSKYNLFSLSIQSTS